MVAARPKNLNQAPVDHLLICLTLRKSPSEADITQSFADQVNYCAHAHLAILTAYRIHTHQ